MSERMIRPCARSVGLGAAALVSLANCGETVADRFPPLPGDEWGDPYPDLDPKGEEAAMHASTSCDLSFTTPPVFSPGGVPDTGCPCTRRQGPQAETAGCVLGSDWGVAATVGPEGGDLLLRHTPFLERSGLAVLLHIPPNALPEPTMIRIVETSVPPPAGYADGAPIYVFEPVGLAFAVPASVKVPWYYPEVGPLSPKTYWSSEADPCALEFLADNHDNVRANEGTVVTRLGWAAVGLPLPGAMPACP
jgi:hypothetical protein